MTLRYRTLPAQRRGKLKELLAAKSGLRIIEAHDGLSGLIGATTMVDDKSGGQTGFDGLWVSSLTDSAAKGHPDTEVIDVSSRLQTIQEILQVTNKPIIVDGDTGGAATQFEYFCNKLESMGVSAVVIEDKQFPKRNSLEKDALQILEDPIEFATKVNRAKRICLTDSFMIFTRIESFIAGTGLEDALHRASIYLDSLADGILIHSNAKEPDEVYAFMEGYRKLCDKKGVRKPIICVPTTYNQILDTEFFDKGFNVVIYANQPMRAAYRAMKTACESILTNQRSLECEKNIAKVSEIMEIVGFSDVKINDVRYMKKPLPVVILGAGKPAGFADTELQKIAVSAAPIAGKKLIERQITTLKEVGFSDITLVSGYGRDSLPAVEIKIVHHDNFAASKVANSLMLVRDKFEDGFIMLFGDVIFDKKLLQNYLSNSDSDILLLVDNSFSLTTRRSIKPTTDLVILNDEDHGRLRKPNMVTEYVSDIGSSVPLENATHEFIGIAKFSKQGARLLQNAYDRIIEAAPTQAVDFNTLIKYLIANGALVEALEVNQGWSEVHTLSDISAIEKEINRNTKKREAHVVAAGLD